jgi:DNA-binding CsgD family transcriptional regulator
MRVDSHLVELDRLRTRCRQASVGQESPQARAAHVGLTPRELVVLSLLAEGLTAAAIARRLRISPHTVTKHQENLYRKLKTSDRLMAVLIAQRQGLL